MTSDEMRHYLIARGYELRVDDDRVIQRSLDALGIEGDCELGWFFRAFNPVFLVGKPVELLDILEPKPDHPTLPPLPPWEAPVGGETVFVREVWDVPDEFLCLSTTDTDHAFLYHLSTGHIYDFSHGQYEELRSGALPPRWKTFFEFLEWYLT